MQTIAATRMLLGGQRVCGEGAPVRVLNPSTGEETISFPGASIAQVKRAIADARTSFDGGTWATLAAIDRVAVLRRFLQIVTARADDLKRLIVTETGVPVNSFALDAQVGSPLRQMEAMLDLYLRLPEIEENPLALDERVGLMGGMVQSVRRHVPVVVAISAYNFPVHISLWKVLPALATGNSVILRPSPLTPLSALWMVDAAIEAGIPAGVLSIVAESGADGALLLTTDPAIDMVTFTGSSEVGRKVAVQAASTLKRVQLELGGKSAQIYLPDRVEAVPTIAIRPPRRRYSVRWSA
jgi:aldehyde dehydrogenase (NAD+)